MKDILMNGLQRKDYVQETKKFEIIIFFFILMLISFVVLVFQFSESNFISEFKKFKRIKRNLNNFQQNILIKSNIESIKGKRIFSSSLSEFKCYDYGSYLVAARLNKNNYLPEFIENGDIWMISKSDSNDISANQFCQYIISSYSDNVITCGSDMYNKLGYGGYFNYAHPCNNILEKMVNVVTNN